MSSPELVLYVRGTRADFDRLFRVAEAAGIRLADDGPGCAEIVTLKPTAKSPPFSGTVTQFVRRQVTP